MQVLGNLGLLKKEIENSYAAKLEEFMKENLERFNKEKSGIEDKHRQEIKKLEAKLENEEKKAFRTILSEEKLNAKREFENFREELINEVLDAAREKSKESLLRNEYISFIRKFIEGRDNIEIIGSFEEYRQHFPDIRIDNKINGIIVRHDKEIFDFSYKTFIESGKQGLRHKISRILFENVS
ncbi:MAG: hypothetical protein KAK00_01970 [Nanoarchaeota archaeon]|nr:hypothetical protein [Nanoarchaeota archaeon]